MLVVLRPDTVKRTGLGRIVSVAAATVPAMTPEPCCPVMELRQYTLRPGQREVLIELFDRELVEPQEKLGMRIVGQFRDLDRPDRFVWLRGFADMQTRLAGLTAFYGGPAWKAHAAAANATMLDVDDVLLLRPAGDNTAFPRSTRAHAGAAVITVTVYPVPDSAAEQELLEFLHARVDPTLFAAGRHPLAELRTEPAVNTFPALPVRESEHVVVRLARYPTLVAYQDYCRRVGDSVTCWNDLADRLAGPPQRLRLQPTPGSRLH